VNADQYIDHRIGIRMIIVLEKALTLQFEII
jgi:hypothetical protein